MTEYLDGHFRTLHDHTVEGDRVNLKGQKVKNPRKFPYQDKAEKKKKYGLSIRVKKIEGLGLISFLEVCCFGEAYKEAVKLKLVQGDRISFHGKCETTEGHTANFFKVNINDPLQIARFSRRTATAREI